MFGMLDYRANKLFLILFGLPLFLLTWMFVVANPFAAYLISYEYFDSSVSRVVGGIALLVVLELVLIPIAYLFDKGIWFVFSLLVDVIPADGRSKEEAQLVVRGGEQALVALRLAKHPREWDSELVERVVKADWVQRLFYRSKVTDRFNFIRCRYREIDRENPDYPYNSADLARIMTEGGCARR